MVGLGKILVSPNFSSHHATKIVWYHAKSLFITVFKKNWLSDVSFFSVLKAIFHVLCKAHDDDVNRTHVVSCKAECTALPVYGLRSVYTKKQSWLRGDDNFLSRAATYNHDGRDGWRNSVLNQWFSICDTSSTILSPTQVHNISRLYSTHLKTDPTL